ncbi:adenosine kinase [Recurvomyces mirabilis]|uniref:Adenosine kinase n=1 Tax=Recurvomyces mirabilis TaxID=574656 RepID=A0AAE0TSA9_9PEZI|nr:adenosine kinase [Recurvomyces mirabilis]KAK4575058.1 adenosine kinase [Recurvomyces mirabilis]KAK5161076.1 adenosine kinase [Recurvomyces mirabilis]
MSSSGTYELLCLENPLLDIQASCDDAFLEKYGLKANDAILAEEKHMGIYEELLKRDAKLIAGGAAQNTARGAQYMLPPNSVIYIGCVGKDKYADILLEANKKAGLAVKYRYDEKVGTGRCGVVITGHNRSMCTDLAAANCYKIEHLKENWDVVEKSKAYYVGGYHLTVCVEAVMALAEEANKENKPFFLSLSAPFIPQFFKDPLDQTAPYWDYVVGNETEATTYADSHDLNTHDIASIAKHMANLPKKNNKRKRVAIVTQGTDPTIIAIQGEDEVKTFPVHKIDGKEIVDTTGAGDAFAGGFFAGVAKGEKLETCVDMGQWLAAQSLRELGPSYPFPAKTYSASS